MNERTGLAEKLELIGSLFEIDGVEEQLGKLKAGMSIFAINAITTRVESILLKADKELADRLVAAYRQIDLEQVNEYSDKDYTITLREAILTEVIGFFI